LTFGAILFIIVSNNTFAGKRKVGSFELAHRGSLFLDEIGEMPEELQVKILRAVKGGFEKK
jgi:transcriptional regulator with PAS, ATPase and Fis domain